MVIDSTKKVFVLILCFACFQTATAAWIKQDSGTLAWFRSVYFITQNKGWIVGSQGTFLTTNDGGKTLRRNKKITMDNILDVYFSDEKNGWLLCERNIYNLRNQPPSYLMKTSDGGISWEKIDFFEGKERIVRFFFFAQDGVGIAIGERGVFLVLQNDKKTWKKLHFPVQYLMLDGQFIDSLRGLVTGGGGAILLTEDRGLTWNQVRIADNLKTKLTSIFFIDQKMGWAVGEKGKIYFTSNGGRLWSQQVSNVSTNLADVFFINASEGFAVGESGTILHTITGGHVWKSEEINSKHKLEKLFFVGEKGFAVGFGGTFLIYDPKTTQ